MICIIAFPATETGFTSPPMHRGDASRVKRRHVESLADLATALEWAKANDRATVISIVTDAHACVRGDADRDVGAPEVSTRDSVNAARESQTAIRAKQRIGV